MPTTSTQDQTIYDRDILLWVETTVAKLKATKTYPLLNFRLVG
jgi:hypothetical protein